MPYWRLSLCYFFYFASLGAFVPYIGPYLQGLGYNAVEIGQLLAVVMASKVVGPILMGWLSDHTGQGLALTRKASFLAALFFAGSFVRTDFTGLFLVMLGFSLFWNATLPQLEVITLTWLGGESHHYTRIRLWGSIGFIVAVLVLGQQIARWGDISLLLAMTGTLLLTWAMVCLIRAPQSQAVEHSPPIFKILQQREVMLFLLSCFLLQASHAPYYTFYSIFVQQQGYDQSLNLSGIAFTEVSLLWSLAVLAEVFMFILLRKLLMRYHLRHLFLWALCLSTMRWLCIGLGYQHLAWLILAQLLHAASFATFHGVAIQLVHRYFVGRTQGRGQSLYGAVSFGAGGAIGAILSGYYWEKIGGDMTFLWAAVVSLLAWGVVWMGVRSSIATERAC